MVFDIIDFCGDWLVEHVPPPVEVSGSLAVQMSQRAEQQERLRQQKAKEEQEREQERANKLAKEIEEKYEADALRMLLASQNSRRKRANSEATEVPGDIPTETFDDGFTVNGMRYDTVKYFHPRNYCLGVLYAADVVTETNQVSIPLELYVVTFQSPYYTTNQGRKKLTQIETDIQRLINVHHSNVLDVLAVKLIKPNSSEPPQLMILSEQPPALTLWDVLEDSECLREDRASDYAYQIFAGLQAIHSASSELFHRSINPRTIALASREQPTASKLVKLQKVSFHARLLELHKSNPFASHITTTDDYHLPAAWISRDADESPLLYSRQRDIHDVGIVFLQMLVGLDVVDRFSDLASVFTSSTISSPIQGLIYQMLFPKNKKLCTCAYFFAELNKLSPVSVLNRSPVISVPDVRTPMAVNPAYSPEAEYFKTPLASKHIHNGARPASRWKEDWEELELLGRGAYGSVVKARNKIDDRIYAVKKVRLKAHSDAKIFREVNALSRLSHRFIVRYYTTWLETSDRTDPISRDMSTIDSDSEQSSLDDTSVPASAVANSNVNIELYDDLDELDNLSASRGSFPSIHFRRASSSAGEDTDSDPEPADDFFIQPGFTPPVIPQFHKIQRTLYIQMEFVERQTLKEQVNEGLSEDEAWRLFKQILEALVHMASLGILHRDIKLTNIFIDAKGDVKVGDFGLATSSLAEVDPSDVSPNVVALRSDMTLDVGTTLYIAPEVQSRKRGPTNHTKADLYSLGIVFFEMNFPFKTAVERIRVIENLRKPSILFPAEWDPIRVRQRDIITQLLNHDPNKRPSALELSQSPLLPHGLEDEYFRAALQMISRPESQYHEAALSSLFRQPQNVVRSFLYDMDTEPPESASLLGVIIERLVSCFRLLGAIEMEPSLLMPVFDMNEEKKHAVFLDRYGDIVTLPNNALVPFARLAAKAGYTRIKRYHIRDIYRPNVIAGHPKVQKAAVFDIISTDLTSGLTASAAEIIALANRILDSFPNLVENYDIFLSHSTIVDLILDRIPATHRNSVLETLYQSKIPIAQKKVQLAKKGLNKHIIDELEILSDFDEIDSVISRLEKISSSLVLQFRPYIEDMKTVVLYAYSAGATRPLLFHPLMVGSHNSYFKDGIIIEVARKSKRMDILAAGGRYDNLIRRYTSPTSKSEAVGAYAFQISIEKIKTALLSHQSSSVKSLIKEERSFGYWTRKRCDVYIVSHQPGYLQDRLEVAAYLWKNNISCDLVYESGLQHAESYVDRCADEGILFILYLRSRVGKRDQAAFKVKSVLSREETEVSRQDLVQWLRQEIAEQRRIDITTAQAPLFAEDYANNLPSNSKPVTSVVQPVLPVMDTKKQRKQVKNIFEDRAFETAEEIRKIFLKPNGMPTIAIDVPPVVFDQLVKSSSWLMDEEMWKEICAAFPTQQASYPQQIKEAVLKKKADGFRFILLYAVKEERMQLLQIQ